jgi:hypothetical protein
MNASAIVLCRYAVFPMKAPAFPTTAIWGLPTTAVPTKNGITTVWRFPSQLSPGANFS